MWVTVRVRVCAWAPVKFYRKTKHERQSNRTPHMDNGTVTAVGIVTREVTGLCEWRVAAGSSWVWQSISTIFGVQVHGYVTCVA